jgi:type IV secretion system protein VirB6
LNYVLLVVLFSALFGLMMDIYGGYVAGVKFESGVNVAYSLGGAIILSIAMVLVLLQLPGIAGALAGGAALGYMHELRAIRGGAASVSRASGMSAAGRQASRAGGWAASKAGGSIKTGASKAYGYFKGRAA